MLWNKSSIATRQFIIHNTWLNLRSASNASSGSVLLPALLHVRLRPDRGLHAVAQHDAVAQDHRQKRQGQFEFKFLLKQIS
jgi:hypothetical protein